MRRWIIISFGLLVGFNWLGAGVAADFDGDSRDDLAIFRETSGLWAVRGVTRVYFGGSGDEPRAGDYDGDGIADIAIFRGSSGLWAVRGLTRAYFGGSSDNPIQGGGGQRTYDYVVKLTAEDPWLELKAALESDEYDSVFIPAGEYSMPDSINVGHVTRITGESAEKTIIRFASVYNVNLEINSTGCRLENIQFEYGGVAGSSEGTVHVNAAYVSIQNCRSSDSKYAGFSYTASADYVSFIDCIADSAASYGFVGPITMEPSARFSNCAARQCTVAGFRNCNNLSSCYVWGNSATTYGFSYCDNLAACRVVATTGAAYSNCNARCTESCN